MDRTMADAIREDALAALQPVAERYGLSVEIAGGKYTREGSYEPRVVFSSDGFAQTEWNRYAALHDLPLDCVGLTFTLDGSRWTVVGFRSRNRSYPIAVTNESGEPRKMRLTESARKAIRRAKELET
jgi:hypothetical protein